MSRAQAEARAQARNLRSIMFSRDQLKSVKKVPKHVAIMMDGNRRWAKKKSFTSVAKGHEAGAAILEDIVSAAEEMRIKILTVWAFSTDNWKRPRFEVNTLIRLIDNYLKKNQKKMVERGVKFSFIGDITFFPKNLQENVKSTMKATKEGKNIELVVGLNYGGRDEIKRGVQRIVQECFEKKIKQSEITEELIGNYLDTAPFGDPDLIIRTSNEHRLSNFFLWQAAYAELFVTEALWPDFRPKHLLEAVLEFQKRERRQGK